MSTSRRLRFRRPRKSHLFFTGLGVIALGLAMALDGFAHPGSRPEQFSAFTSSGEFSYTAQLVRADPVVYPGGVAQTGEPLIIGDVDQASISFAYTFHSKLQHEVNGTIALQVIFLGDSGWRNAYNLVSPVPFTGDTASATGTLSLPTLGQMLAKLQAGSAVAARSYTVYLQPVVRYEGSVDSHKVKGTFSPTLPFTLDAAVFAPQALNVRDPSQQAQILDAELHPTQAANLQHSVANVISFAGLRASAIVFRIGGLLIALLGAVIVSKSQKRRRRDDIWSHEKRVAFRAGRSLVEVKGLEETLPPGSVMTDVATFDDLVAVAVQGARPILREAHPDVEVFAVDLPPRLYRYRKPVQPAAEPVAADRARSTAPPAHSRGRFGRARPLTPPVKGTPAAGPPVSSS
jgi:hypothetical protein